MARMTPGCVKNLDHRVGNSSKIRHFKHCPKVFIKERGICVQEGGIQGKGHERREQPAESGVPMLEFRECEIRGLKTWG